MPAYLSFVPERLRGCPNLCAIFFACLALADDAGVVVDAREKVTEATGLPISDVVLGLVELSQSDDSSGLDALLEGLPWELIRISNFDRFEPARPRISEARREANAIAQERWRQRHLSFSDASQQAVELYGIYPKKVGRKAALRAIELALKRAPYETILEGVRAYSEAISHWPKEQCRFVPAPATWFGQDRWDDDRSTWNRNASVSDTPIHTRLRLLTDAINEHPANHEWRGYDRHSVTQEQRDHLERLRRQYADLRSHILAEASSCQA